MPKVSEHPQLLLCVCGALAVGALCAALVFRTSLAAHYLAPALLIAAAAALLRWWQVTRRWREVREIRSRLEHLPDEFEVLHDLFVPSTWGFMHVDHVILSRFGVVVAADGIAEGVAERTEAVRSYLVGIGAARPSAPIRTLVLMPPGGARGQARRLSTPAVGIEEMRTQHLTPTPDPVFSPHELQTISDCLRQAECW